MPVKGGIVIIEAEQYEKNPFLLFILISVACEGKYQNC